MKPGEEYKCPHCGQNSFLKKESVMDGWAKKGEVLKCASCGVLVCELKEPDPTQKKDPLASDAATRFKDLLGADEFIPKPQLTAEENDSHFCKDCAYLIPHPFVTRCSKKQRTVDPMDDCPDFQPREK